MNPSATKFKGMPSRPGSLASDWVSEITPPRYAAVMERLN
jgi:hypothetical protein